MLQYDIGVIVFNMECAKMECMYTKYVKVVVMWSKNLHQPSIKYYKN